MVCVLVSCHKNKDDDDGFSVSGKTYYTTETVSISKNTDASKTVYYIYEFTDSKFVKYYERESSFDGKVKNQDNGSYTLSYPSITLNMGSGSVSGTFYNENLDSFTINGKTFNKK